MKILIVKTSSLGDIIQCFPAIEALRRKFPEGQIDWAVEESFSSLVKECASVSNVISLPLQKMKQERFFSWEALQKLRHEKYLLVFDFQGNCKSGLITFLSRGQVKVGFSLASVSEWPNILATTNRYFVPKHLNMRLQYHSLIEQYFQEKIPIILKKTGKRQLTQVMVCPGSKWINKQLSEETWIDFLSQIHRKYQTKFMLIWGTPEEKAMVESIQKRSPHAEVLLHRLSIPEWRDLMRQMDLVIAVDSSALHLCGTTETPSFAIFGPTSQEVFNPMGEGHFAFQGTCPYGQSFVKQCPLLRSCKTGACTKDLSGDTLFQAFEEERLYYSYLTQTR